MSQYNEQNNFDFLDMLAILAFIIQVLDYDITVKQSSNDDILKELRADMAEIKKENLEIQRLLKQ